MSPWEIFPTQSTTLRPPGGGCEYHLSSKLVFHSSSFKIDFFCTFGYVNLKTYEDAELNAEVTKVDPTR